ncbi:hypothetical protein [Methylobacterium radiotolerans]|uniref:hypothetical protein n=1 Tax=Methylobacterium radiotolerans TaxID=31998 RepID=UPI0038D077FB
MIDERFEIAFQAAFDRAEGAILEAADRSGETVVYTYSFQRRPSAGGGAGGSLLPAIAAAGIGFAMEAGWTGSTALAGARIAAVCSRSIVVATPDRRGVAIRRIPLEAVRTLTRSGGSVAIGTVDEVFVLHGMTDPKRFVKEAARSVELVASHASAGFRPATDGASQDEDAVAVAAIRRRLRDRGWMLAAANDYRLGGRWQVYYGFVHPDGLSAKGEGGSDAEALSAAEADATAKEHWLADLKGSAA